MCSEPAAKHGRSSGAVPTGAQSGKDCAFKIIRMFQESMNRRGETFWQRASLAKGQGCFRDIVRRLLQGLAGLEPDLLTDLWFDGEHFFFHAKKCGGDIASLKEL